MIAAIVLITVNVLHAQSNPFRSSQPGYPGWSAFTGIEWDDGQPIVEFEDQWYELVSIHGVTTEEILEECRTQGWGRRKACL